MRENPITLCVAGLLVTTWFSQLVNASPGMATTIGFSKACVFYLLIVSLLDTRQRFDWYLRWFGIILLAFASLMALYHLGIVHSDSQASLLKMHEGRGNAFGSQSFNDPNDTALVLVVGVLVSVHLAVSANKWFARAFWFAAAGLSLYAVKITDSRAGFLALCAGACTYVWARWGTKQLLWLCCLSPLVVAQIASSRMTDLGAVNEGTGQERVQFWHTALLFFKGNPITGIGPDNFTALVGKASHNSFLQAYAELGFAGGTFFFFAAFAGVVCAWQTISILRTERSETDSDLYFTLALVVAYSVGVFTLNHLYTSISYLVFALTTASLHIERELHNITGFPWKDKFVPTLVLASCSFVVANYILAQLLVNW